MAKRGTPPSRQILWLEDDIESVDSVRRLLESSGHSVVVAASLAEAEATLKSVPRLDAILTDVLLPSEDGMDRLAGVRFAQGLRSGTYGTTHAQVPVVCFTGSLKELPAVDGVDGMRLLRKQDTTPSDLVGLVEGLISVPSLLGPDGMPIASSSQRYAAIAAELRAISDDAFREIGREPSWMLDLHWRDWEELVAEIFTRRGFDVTRTPDSRDRGVDLYAVGHSTFGRFLYVIECKRWRPDRPIGPRIVRELRGVVDREGANCGVIATTSYFTDGAVEEQGEQKFRLSLADLERVSGWMAGADTGSDFGIQRK